MELIAVGIVAFAVAFGVLVRAVKPKHKHAPLRVHDLRAHKLNIETRWQ